MSEAKEEYGSVLAEVVFKEMHPVLRPGFGLEPPLDGPGDELWVSPSDLLIGKVCLKPPLTQKHIQALTHQGILEIGAVIEQKFWNEMEAEKLRALAEREAYLNRKFELEKNRLISEMRDSEQLKYLEQIETLRDEFDTQMQETIHTFEEEIQRLTEECDSERDGLNAEWQSKYDDAINTTTTRLTQEFLVKMGKQEQVLAKIFKKQLANCETKKRCAIEFERTKCRETLMQLKHNLECKNIANLMYMLCKERRMCRSQKETITTDFERRLRHNRKTINAKTHRIKSMTRITERQARQLLVRERCLTEIIKQYQKLLYFALRASPTQAEFLLDIEKLIRYELRDSCILDRRPGDYSDPTKILFPKRKIEEATCASDLVMKASERSQGAGSDVNDIFQDSAESALESDALPAFYFNEKMYVRQEFRDMLSAGVSLEKKKCPLWNRDVEELINVFKASVTRERHLSEDRSDNKILSKIKSHPSSVRFDRFSQESEEIVLSTTIATPQADPVEFTATSASADKQQQPVKESSHHSETVEIYDEMKAIQTKDTLSTASGASKSEIRTKKISYSQANDSSAAKSSGIQSKPSLSMRRQSAAASPSATPTIDSKSNIVIKPSQTSRRMSTMPAEFQAIPSSTLLPRKSGQATQSRLTLARDSVILRISSIERKSLMNISKENTNTKPTAADDEGSIRSTESLGKEEEQEETAELTKVSRMTTSRLVLATDSVEMLKSSTKIQTISEKRASMAVPLDEVEMKRKSNQELATVSIKPPVKETQRKTSVQPNKASSMKSSQKTRIAGKAKGNVRLQNPKEFTEERVHSLVNLMKDNPSLLRLFTSCSK